MIKGVKEVGEIWNSNWAADPKILQSEWFENPPPPRSLAPEGIQSLNPKHPALKTLNTLCPKQLNLIIIDL